MSTADLREMIADLIRSQKETDAKFKETDKQIRETGKQIKELGKQIGGIGDKFGSFTEGLAYPSMTRVLYEKFGIDNTVANYLRRLPDGRCVEYDAFGYTNGNLNNAVVVEVKSHLKHEHVDAFVEKMGRFRQEMPPEYHDKHLYGVICTVRNVSSELRSYVENAGLFIATARDNVFRLHDNKRARDFGLGGK